MKKKILSLLLATSYLTCMGKWFKYDSDFHKKYEINRDGAKLGVICSAPLTYLSYKILSHTSKKVLEDAALYKNMKSVRRDLYIQDKKFGSYALWLLKNNLSRVKIAAKQTAAAGLLCMTTTFFAKNLIAACVPSEALFEESSRHKFS